MKKQSNFPTPPSVAKKPTVFSKFGIERTDNYFWLKDKTNENVIEYLNAENAYRDMVMTSTKALQDTIFNEIIGRIKEDDESYPVFENGYFYYSRSEKGKEYRTYCRKHGSLDADEVVLFDVNQMAEGQSAFLFNEYAISPDNQKAAYLYNETGSYAEFTLKIRDLETGNELAFVKDGVMSVAWASDSDTLFYSEIDDTLRSSKIYRHQLSTGESELVFEETDARFYATVSECKTGDFVFISSFSSSTSEEQFVSSHSPTDAFKVILPRKQDVKYFCNPHQDGFYVRYQDKQSLNGKLYLAPFDTSENMETWTEILPHRDTVRIEEVDVFADYLVIELRENGLINLQTYHIESGKLSDLTFPEVVYQTALASNPEYNATKFRYSYESLNRPATLFEYDMLTGESITLKQQEIPSGFNPDDYTVERIWANAPDGVKVPYSIVYKKGLEKNSNNPAFLRSYGSYGSSSDVYFSPTFYSLIDRGFIFGIAHIRGGSDLGEQWYEDGKLLKKMNTFTDFIACSEDLIAKGYTSSDKLTISGGSAGGLLMGAVANLRPDLFKTIVSLVPFVDVMTTMLDDTLPLTTGEYEEWGNPNDEEYFSYMLSYSPYDNLTAKDYPNMYITGGLNDSQVLFHEPAKYVAKLRELKTDDSLLVMDMDMESGHGGSTGRYGFYRDVSRYLAFVLEMS